MRLVKLPLPTSAASDVAYFACFFLYWRSALMTVRMKATASVSGCDFAGAAASCASALAAITKVTAIAVVARRIIASRIVLLIALTERHLSRVRRHRLWYAHGDECCCCSATCAYARWHKPSLRG